MNSSHPIATSVGLPHDRFAFPRYRVCRLATDGEINRRITATDSPEIAVLDFLNVTTLRRGDNLYVGTASRSASSLRSSGSMKRRRSAAH